jgi:tRNA-specific 2-thiouridylase
VKIAVLASGGVDSSVVLKLLQHQGHEVTAFYLKIWLEDELSFLGNCPWEEDLAYIRQICAENSIPLELINLQKEYHQEVVAYALKEIKAGRTPNSDLLCNSKIKFGKFYEKIGPEFDLVASGHYADKLVKDGLHYLTRAKDPVKDQTYFLAHLSQQQLQRAIFPLGPYLKSEVRELAGEFHLPNQARKDSQGICFLGKIKYNDFVRFHLGEKPGDLIDFDTGKKMGEHRGYWFYTIGQRKGIELSGGPWYVVKKDLEANLVYISNTYHDLDKKRDSFEVEDLHWISGAPAPDQLAGLEVKVRHGEKLYPAAIQLQPGQTRAVVHIEGSDQGFAAGQFAVFYSGPVCLGCGTISG